MLMGKIGDIDEIYFSYLSLFQFVGFVPELTALLHTSLESSSEQRVTRCGPTIAQVTCPQSSITREYKSLPHPRGDRGGGCGARGRRLKPLLRLPVFPPCHGPPPS